MIPEKERVEILSLDMSGYLFDLDRLTMIKHFLEDNGYEKTSNDLWEITRGFEKLIEYYAYIQDKIKEEAEQNGDNSNR